MDIASPEMEQPKADLPDLDNLDPWLDKHITKPIPSFLDSVALIERNGDPLVATKDYFKGMVEAYRSDMQDAEKIKAAKGNVMKDADLQNLLVAFVGLQ